MECTDFLVKSLRLKKGVHYPGLVFVGLGLVELLVACDFVDNLMRNMLACHKYICLCLQGGSYQPASH